MLLKPSRYITTMYHTMWSSANISQRFDNEVRACNVLHHEGLGVVSFIGVYSDKAHPLGLIYEFMDGLDLRQYLRNEPDVGKLKLVIACPLHTRVICPLIHLHS